METTERPPCPFYGFYIAMNKFHDQAGNQGAMLTDSYSPCRMELGGETPNWNGCEFNNKQGKQSLERLADEMHFFPEEFRSEKNGSWKGIPFKDWQKIVMKQKPKA